MVIIALGGNTPGLKGVPIETMRWAIGEMTNVQIYVMAHSFFYRTKPVGQEGQPDYVNAVIRAQTSLSAANVLKNLKLIERTAGRDTQQMRISGQWGPRPLDLDIVDYKGMICTNYHVCSRDNRVTNVGKMRQCSLVLPHPRAHLRPFVIRPLIDVDPFWHHPVTGHSVLSLWKKMRNRAPGQILHRID